MKILFLHRNLPPDSFTGVAIQVHRLANALVELGHEVTIISQSRKPIDAQYNVTVFKNLGLRISLKMFPFFKRILFPVWYTKIKVVGYDAIHIHGDGGFLKYQGNFVRTFYGTAALEYRNARNLKGKIAQGFSYWMEKRESKKCRLTIGISPHVAAYLPGVDKIIPCMLPPVISDSFPTKTIHPSLIFIGSRFSRKRGEFALELFRNLTVQFPNITMTYVTSESEAKLLNAQPENKGISFKAKLNQVQINEGYQSSWFTLCLSSYEGFGLSIIEGMSAGNVVLSTPHQGSEYLLQNGLNGIITPFANFQSQISNLILNTTLREKISRNAFLWAKKFSPEKIAREYLDIYKVAAHRKLGKPV